MAGKKSSFSDFKIAAGMRDVITQIVRAEVNRIRPESRIAQVKSINQGNLTAEVSFAGDTGSVNARFGLSLMPKDTNAIVRVAGSTGNYYITEIVNQAGGNALYEPILIDYEEGNLTPPPPTDGLPPASAPVLTATPGIRSIALKWTEVDNADFTTYAVYVAAASPVVVGESTLYGTVAGTSVMVTAMPNGTPLANGAQTFAKVVPLDRDGEGPESNEVSAVPRLIETIDFGPGSVNATAIAEGSVTSFQLANLTISTVDLANDSVQASKIIADAVITDKIFNDAVLNAKLATNAVNQAKLTDDAVGVAEILVNAVTASEISANAVTAADMLAGTVTATEIFGDTITANKIATNAIGVDELAANSVVAGDIAASAVTATELAANSITAADVLANTMTANEINANAVTASELAANSVVAGDLAASAVTAGTIAALAITTGDLAANAITADKLDAFAITAKHTLTGPTIQTATSGNRALLNTSGLFFIGSSGGQSQIWTDSTGRLQLQGPNNTATVYLRADGQIDFGGNQVNCIPNFSCGNLYPTGSIYMSGAASSVRNTVENRAIFWSAGDARIVEGTNTTFTPIRASAFVVSSTRAIKKNIKDSKYGLSQLMQLKSSDYEYKVNVKNRPMHDADTGFILEDVLPVYPPAVGLDTEGNPTGLDYGKFTPLIVKSVQELSTELSSVKAELASLKQLVESK